MNYILLLASPVSFCSEKKRFWKEIDSRGEILSSIYLIFIDSNTFY